MKKSPGDLHFENLPTRWDEALPLGNGMVGALVWQQREGQLRLSLDRADLWDLRPVEELKKMTFDWVHQQVEKGDYDTVHQLGDQPYNQKPFPTKIQAAGLNFNTGDLGKVQEASLFIKPAEARIKWSEGADLHTFVHATRPMGWFRFENVPEDFKPQIDVPAYGPDAETPGQEAGQQQQHKLSDLGYEQGKVIQNENIITYTQPGWGGMQYQVVVTWKNEGSTCEGVWSISSRYPDQQKRQSAGEIATRALAQGYDHFRTSHLEWWNEYWAKSQVRVPDSLIQQQYEREMYKFGAVARQGAPAITLQAVWTADNGSLPPWKGDFHHDLNTQLSYWPGYAGNHLDLTQSFTDWLWEVRKENKNYTQWYFESEGLNVPGVTTLTGQPMGGWIQYSMSPTVSAWLAQHFYWQWVYSRDEQFLRERAYPYLHDVAVYLEDITYLEEGIRTLPLSSSPEIHNNSIEAWYTSTTNYDLALMKKAFAMAAELAGKMGKTEDQSRWEKRKEELPPFSTNRETGLLVAPDEPLENSHRHFSHLMAIHPLGLLDPAHSDKEKQLIKTSLEHLDETGSDGWTGYSFSWQANLYARAGMGSQAAEALRIFASNFVSPNSFHLNGDQKGGEYSDFTYRPFTLEGNFAFAAGLQEMLMQSNTGVIEIFPAIPEDWQKVSFEKLRARGAFLVSAQREKGKITQVNIEAEKGGQLMIDNPFDTKAVEMMVRGSGQEDFLKEEPQWENDLLTMQTSPGQVIKLVPVI